MTREEALKFVANAGANMLVFNVASENLREAGPLATPLKVTLGMLQTALHIIQDSHRLGVVETNEEILRVFESLVVGTEEVEKQYGGDLSKALRAQLGDLRAIYEVQKSGDVLHSSEWGEA